MYAYLLGYLKRRLPIPRLLLSPFVFLCSDHNSQVIFSCGSVSIQNQDLDWRFYGRFPTINLGRITTLILVAHIAMNFETSYPILNFGNKSETGLTKLETIRKILSDAWHGVAYSLANLTIHMTKMKKLRSLINMENNWKDRLPATWPLRNEAPLVNLVPKWVSRALWLQHNATLELSTVLILSSVKKKLKQCLPVRERKFGGVGSVRRKSECSTPHLGQYCRSILISGWFRYSAVPSNWPREVIHPYAEVTTLDESI